MAHQKTPLTLPEILLHVSQYLDLQDCISASRVSHLWHKTFTSVLPSGTVLWNDALSEDERAAALDQLCHHHVRTLDAHFRYWVGKALYYMRDRDAQKRAWEPFKQALIQAAEETTPAEADKTMPVGRQDNSIQRQPLQLQKLIIRGGMSPDEDYLPILFKIKTLRHLHLDATPGREFRIDISKLYRYLGHPPLQTLRQLTVKHMWWPNMTALKPVQSQLAKLVLEGTDMPELGLSQLLASCPLLEELVAIDTLPRWNAHMFKNLSTINPLLQALTFSIKPSAAGEECNDAQVEILIDSMTLDLKALGLYRLNCSSLTFERLHTRFPNLTRFEIHGKSNPACGPMVHQMLCRSPQLVHLKAKDVFIPMALLRDRDQDQGEDGTTPLRSWVCSDLRTLEVSFGDHFETKDGGSRAPEEEDKVRAETRVLFAYLVRHVARLERLSLHKHGLSLRRGDGIELIKDGLPRLERLCLMSESLPAQAEEEGNGSVGGVVVRDPTMMDLDELEGLEAQLKMLSLRATAVDPPMYGPPLKDPRQKHPDGYYVR